GGGDPARFGVGDRRRGQLDMAPSDRRRNRADAAQAWPHGALARTFTTPGTPAAKSRMIPYTSRRVRGTGSDASGNGFRCIRLAITGRVRAKRFRASSFGTYETVSTRLLVTISRCTRAVWLAVAVSAMYTVR